MVRNTGEMIQWWLLIIFLWKTVSSQEITNDNNNAKESLQFEIITSNRQYIMNLTGLYQWTSSVLMVDFSSQNNSDFQNDYIRQLYLNGDKVIVVKMDSKIMDICSNCNVSNIQIGLKQLMANKQIVFAIYENYESVSEMFISKKWSIFDESPRSFFVIVIVDKTIKGIPCESIDFEVILKNATKILFDRIWTKYRVLETVVYYPNLCGGEKILKYNPVENFANDNTKGVSYISKVDIESKSDALLHMYNNLQGYPLRVKMFGRTPTSVKNLSQSMLNTYLKKDIESIGNIGGIDGFTLANLAKYLNLSAEVSVPADGIEYGYLNNNGTYVGTLGDVIYKKTDISFNGRFLKDYNTKDIEFTNPIFHDQFCVLVPKALRIPAWRNIFLGFSMTAWYAIVATACMTGFMWWIMKAASTHPDPGSRGKMGFCVHFMDACLLIASQPIFLPSLGRERIFVAGCLIFNIIFSGTFQGYLNTAFSTTSHYPDINTLDALDKSGLPIATSSRLNDIFGSGSLQKKIKSIKTAAIDRAAENRDVSAVERRSDARLLIELKYLARDDEPLLHIVNECPRSYYLSYIVYRGYPFLPHINRFITRSIEGGLNDQWYDFTMYSIILQHRSKHQSSSESLKKLTLVDVQTAFFALVIGLLSSIVVFTCETIHFKIKNKREIINRKNARNRIVGSFMFYAPLNIPKYEFTP